MQPYPGPTTGGTAADSSSDADTGSGGFGAGLLTVAGWILFFGCVTLFLLLHSPALGTTSNLVIESWPGVFEPIRQSVVGVLEQINGGGDFGLLSSRLYHAILVLLFGVYFFVLYRAFRSGAPAFRPGSAPLVVILVLTSAMLAVLLFAPGAFTGDLFSYVWYGRVFGTHGGNPYIDVPFQYAAEGTANWLQYLYWKDLPAPYGPVWVLLAGTIDILARALGSGIVLHVLGHKLLACVVHLANTWMLWHVAPRVIANFWPAREAAPEGSTQPHENGTPAARSPGVDVRQRSARVSVTLAYAWNPLLLVEFGVSGHNDGLVIFALLAAIRLHLAGRWRWAVVALALGTLVKVTVGLAFLVPYLGFLFWQARADRATPLAASRLLRIGQAAAIVAVVWVVAWVPFWEGPDTVRAYTNNPGSLFYIHSLGTIIRYTVPFEVDRIADEQGWPIAGSWNAEAIGNSLDQPTRYVLQAIAVLIALFHIWRARTFRGLLVALWWAVFAYLAIGAIWYWPWYASWLVVPMALLGPGRLFTAGQIMCVTSLVVHGLNPATSAVFAPWWAWSGLVINLPPLLYLAGSWLMEAARRRAERLQPATAAQ
ncbi:MAG TPA: hypothetical protein VFR15_06350 [Chloroflexia bacterium]|nr:hypothetical protein [Chloroflexia bacterium]